MSDNITVNFSGLPIKLQNCGSFMRDFCCDYISDEEPVFSVNTTEDEVQLEIDNATEPTTWEYANALCFYRKIAEKLPLYNRAVFHGAAIEFEGKSYIFTAPSGTGKTTHIALWGKFFADNVDIINGDKPILEMCENGFTVHGTPYAGKEGWCRNAKAPLAGICFISRGTENKINRIEKGLLIKLFSQVYMPKDEKAMRKNIEIINALCSVPCFELFCDISENAVKASFEALTNKNYEVYKYENQ